MQQRSDSQGAEGGRHPDTEGPTAPNIQRAIQWVGVAVLLLSAAAVISSCTPEKKYEVLSFFFDGVPRPGETAPEQEISPQYMGNRKPRGPARLDLVQHEPYRRNQCKKCHPEESSLFIAERAPRGICYWCHEHEEFQQRLAESEFLHGPVAVESCLVCHDPHYSRHEGLLVEKTPTLCYFCHEPESLECTPEHEDPAQWKCLNCHDPHGGDNRFFVKADRSAGNTGLSGEPQPAGR